MTKVFLSYAREDEAMAARLYDALVARNLDVWFDKVHIRPGRWRPQILKAITQSRYFVACLSKAALEKLETSAGFQDTELSTAYQIALDQSENRFAIVPVRFEDIDRGDHRLSTFQQYDLYGDDFELVVNRLAQSMGGGTLAPADEAPEKPARTADQELASALYGKATAYFEMRQFDKCVALLDSVEHIDGPKFNSRGDKAAALHALGRYEEALAMNDSALSLRDDVAMLWFNKGTILHSLKRDDEAVESLRHGLTLDPNSTHGLVKSASVAFALDRPEEALANLASVLRIDPAHARAYAMQGVILDRQGRAAEALEASQKAVSLDPTIYVAHATCGYILVRTHRPGEAVPHLQKALELGSRSIRTRQVLVMAFIALGLGSDAAREIDDALKLGPDPYLESCRECLYALAVARPLVGTERNAEAIEILTPVLEAKAGQLGDRASLTTAMAWCLLQALGRAKPFDAEPFRAVADRWLVWLSPANREDLSPLQKTVKDDIASSLETLRESGRSTDP